MAGHTSEKRWRRNQNVEFGNAGVSELASQVCTNMVNTLDEGRRAFNELQELYAFVGSTVPLLADQLFFEDWSERSVTGLHAIVTVDVSGGVVSNPVITLAGTGYEDIVGAQVVLTNTAGGGDGSALLSFDIVAGLLNSVSIIFGGSGYTNGSGQVVQEIPVAGQIFETEANASEISKTQDLFDAITALNELYQAADNIVVLQEDRFAQLRRMS